MIRSCRHYRWLSGEMSPATTTVVVKKKEKKKLSERARKEREKRK